MAEELFNRLAQQLQATETGRYSVFGSQETLLLDVPRLRGKYTGLFQVLRRVTNPPSFDLSKPALSLPLRHPSRFPSPSSQRALSPFPPKSLPNPRSTSVDPASRHRATHHPRRCTDLGLLSVSRPPVFLIPPKCLSGKPVVFTGRSSKPTISRFPTPFQIHNPNSPDSPIKRHYKQLLHRTMKQIERENIAGW